MDIETLRVRRVVARITAQLLAARAHMDRGRISSFERGLIVPTQAELELLDRTLGELEEAKKTVVAAAARVGLPVQGL